MSKQLQLDVAQLTDVGRKRPHNEDNMAYVIPKDTQLMAKKGALFIVADGMGGHAAGEVASEIAVDTVSSEYYKDTSDTVDESLLYAIKRANTLIHQRAAENLMRTGMGTTCVSAVLRGNTAYIANVGDSRAYLVRDSQMRQVSHDHSWVEEQVRAGLLTPDQARSHAQRNVITRSLGTQPEVEVDLFLEELHEGDALLLCSDGLSGYVSDEDMQSIVKQYMPRESVYHLIERANENGGPDNITAIVIYVQEVGWEPPRERHPVHVGGARDEEDTAILGSMPGTMVIPARNNGRPVTTPSRLPSGPLASPESITAPQPALQIARPRRNRLFYPSLAVFVLVLITIFGSAAFLWLNGVKVDINASLTTAQQNIDKANTQLSSNPVAALQSLSSAQTELNRVSKETLSNDQRAKFDKVNKQLTPAVKQAITTYNQQYSITPLACLNAMQTPITSGAAATQAKTLAAMQNGDTTFMYALGDDLNLYQMANNSLGTRIALAGSPQIKQVVGDGQRLLAITSQIQKGSTLYSVSLLAPKAASGADLQEKNVLAIDTALLSLSGMEPTMISAWGDNVYVVLTSTGATSSTTAEILNYTIDKNNQLKFNNKNMYNISISVPLVSIAAFPNNLLFLLNENGQVMSLQLANANTNVNPVPAAVVVKSPINPPLPADAGSYVTTTPVPTLAGQVVAPTQSTVNFLSLSRGSLLTAGQVDKDIHLYVVDSGNHRVLDLLQVPAGSVGGTLSSSTPTAGATSPAPSPTPTGTHASGGGVVADQVTMQLRQQYTSANLLTGVKSIVANPKSAGFYVLAQSGSAPTLVSVDLTQQNSCPSTSLTPITPLPAN